MWLSAPHHGKGAQLPNCVPHGNAPFFFRDKGVIDAWPTSLVAAQLHAYMSIKEYSAPTARIITGLNILYNQQRYNKIVINQYLINDHKSQDHFTIK